MAVVGGGNHLWQWLEGGVINYGSGWREGVINYGSGWMGNHLWQWLEGGCNQL